MKVCVFLNSLADPTAWSFLVKLSSGSGKPPLDEQTQIYLELLQFRRFFTLEEHTSSTVWPDVTASWLRTPSTTTSREGRPVVPGQGQRGVGFVFFLMN